MYLRINSSTFLSFHHVLFFFSIFKCESFKPMGSSVEAQGPVDEKDGIQKGSIIMSLFPIEK